MKKTQVQAVQLSKTRHCGKTYNLYKKIIATKMQLQKELHTTGNKRKNPLSLICQMRLAFFRGHANNSGK